MIQVQTLLLLLLLTSAHAGFDWGAGCDGGTGTFSVNLTTAGQVVDVGFIPSGKWNVKVFLTSSSDVDIQIFDTEDISTFPEGQAVVAWCPNPKTCNIGALGSSETAGTAQYKSMKIGYSGYGGTNGKPGKEYILVEGKTSTTLQMKAFAFVAGVAIVDYSWDRVQTPCCLGIGPCTGEFKMQVPKDESVLIGSIPIIKKNLRVQLYSPVDVDLQLYDVEDKSTFTMGQAIIGYCETTGCNKGMLGNNDGSAESTRYKNRTYEYSGYDGVDGKKGNEYLLVQGISNTVLSMNAFGYAAGEALVSYSYYEDWTSSGPIQPSVDWMIPVNHRDARTSVYENVPLATMLVRRDSSFQLLVSSPNSGVQTSDVQLQISGWVGSEHRFGLGAPLDPTMVAAVTATTNAKYPKSSYRVTTSQKGATRVGVSVLLTEDAPVGLYLLTVVMNVTEGVEIVTYERSLVLVILFNPYGKGDAVRQSRSNVAEYVESDEGLIWQGMSDSNTAHTWVFSQLSFPNLAIALDSLRRMDVTDRGDAALVSRHLTYAVGEDICYGKWGEGSYTTGKPVGGYQCSKTKRTKTHNVCREPGHWSGTTELFNLHRSIGGKKVQYCQCFVYAGVLTTVGRSLGISARPVTNFQSAHDTHADRSIAKYYDLNPSDGVMLPTEAPADAGHDSIWSFHVWTEFFLRRPVLNKALKCKTCSDGWQAVDATPQEPSSGGDSSLPTLAYMMGPASIKLLRSNRDPICRNQDIKFGCFDSQFVISEVNANILMYTSSLETPGTGIFELYPKDCGTKEQCGFPSDPFGDVFATIGLQISTKKKGPISDACKRDANSETPRDCMSDLDDVTSKYKKSEPSGPGVATGSLRRSLRRSLLTTRAKMGMAPSISGPVVNEPGHPGSIVQIGVETDGLESSSSVMMTCALRVTARDYTGALLGEVLNATVNNVATCTFPIITRSSWRRYASTHMDVRDGLLDMEPGSRAYALHFSVTATQVGDGTLILAEERSKIICTPLIGAGSLRTKLFCDDSRGQWLRPAEDTAETSVMQHLDRSVAKKRCVDAGVTKTWASRGGPNDGVCQPSNNVDGCWDGGDCCTFSCWEKNGEFKELGNDGKTWQFAHTCNEVDDSVQCMDPSFAGGAFHGRPLDFTKNIPADSFGVSASGDGDEDQCALGAANLTSYLVAMPSSRGCTDVVEQSFCGDDVLFANTECQEQLVQVLRDAGCDAALPRCAPRTAHGCRCQEVWSFTNTDGATFHFENHESGNPYLGSSDGGYHFNDWCNIVRGSCTKGMNDGSPGSPDYYYDDGSDKSWWDDCGTGNVNHLTGLPLPLVLWTKQDVELVDTAGTAGQSTSSTVLLVEVARAPIPPPSQQDSDSPAVGAPSPDSRTRSPGGAPPSPASSSLTPASSHSGDDDSMSTGVTSDSARQHSLSNVVLWCWLMLLLFV